MILIVDNRRSERAGILREAVFSFGIPCMSVVVENKLIQCAKVILTFKNNLSLIREHYPEVDPEIILISNDSAFYEDTTFSVELRRIYGRLHEILEIKHGINLESYCVDRYTQINGVCRFGGNIFYPTDTEKYIIKTLTLCPMRYFTTHEISMFCYGEKEIDLKNDKTIAVHIYNINQKTRACSMKPIIDRKRNYGYRFVLIR